MAEVSRCVSSASHAGRFRPRKTGLAVMARWKSRYTFIEYCSSFCGHVQLTSEPSPTNGAAGSEACRSDEQAHRDIRRARHVKEVRHA